MILVIGNTKGGAGKSTLAVNIAVARSLSGKNVLLVDGDKQQTAMTFTNVRIANRGNAGYTAICLYESAISAQVKTLAPKYDDVIIDVGGTDNKGLRAAMMVADKVIIPVHPTNFDIWAIDTMAELVGMCKQIRSFDAIAVINMAYHQGDDNNDAAEIISEIDHFQLYPGVIGNRKVFNDAKALGKSVFETKVKNERAISEMTDLINYIYK